MAVRLSLGLPLKDKKMFKGILEYLGKAVKSNTGISSISLILVSIGVMSVIVLIVVCICMLVEVFSAKTINASLDGYASIITAVAGLVASVGLPKALNNYGENKFKSQDDDIVW